MHQTQQFCKEFFPTYRISNTQDAGSKWPRWPYAFFAESPEKMLDMAETAFREFPVEGACVPKCLKRIPGRQGFWKLALLDYVHKIPGAK